MAVAPLYSAGKAGSLIANVEHCDSALMQSHQIHCRQRVAMQKQGVWCTGSLYISRGGIEERRTPLEHQRRIHSMQSCVVLAMRAGDECMTAQVLMQAIDSH